MTSFTFRLKRSYKRSSLILAASVFWIVVWSVFFLFGWNLPAETWARILPGFDLAETAFGPSPEEWIPAVVAIWLGALTLATAALFVLAQYRKPLLETHVRQRVCSLAAAAGVTFILFEGMLTRGFVGPWYSIRIMMTNPSSVPVFGQRLLLIWPAMLLKHLFPQLTYIQAFLSVQGVAIVAAVYIMGEWSALFIGKKQKFIGQILMAVFLLPTFGAFMAHDMGVVIFYTLCFLFLYKRKYWVFGIAFFLGILNHQNILLLIPTAVVVLAGREKRSTIVWLATSTLVVYSVTRLILNATVPIPLTHEIKVWWNMRQIAELKQTLVMGELSVLPWYLFGAFALRDADPFLKRAAILLPMQYGIYFLFGQLNEARLFNGFIPVLIGIFLCYLREHIPAARDAAVSPGAISNADCAGVAGQSWS